jgi:thioesterase domain-containing protein/acyl carrier protein
MAAAGNTSDRRALLRSLLTRGRGWWHLSEAQARLWEIEVREHAPGVHDFSVAYSLRGPLNADLLEEALRAVAGRHVSLRARIVERSGTPCLEEVPLERPIMERCESGTDLSDLLRSEAGRPLDVTAGRGWRATLFRTSPDEHTLLLHFHHIFADRWSLAVLMTDLAAAYGDLHAGRPPALAPALLPVESAPVQEADLLYWKRLFAKAPEPLLLPLTRAGPMFAEYAGARLEFEIDAATTQGLKAAAAAQSTTLFAALAAGFAGFLHSHTGQKDVVLCTPMTGRHHAGSRSVIGYFNNILPMRLDLSGDVEFQTLMADVAASLREIYAAQDVPFHRIAALPEIAGRITQCLVALQNIPGLDLQLPGITSEYRDVPNGTANFDIALFAEEKQGRLRCLFDYKTALLEAAAAELLRDRLVEFLRAASERPSARLSGLPRYSVPEAQKARVTAAEAGNQPSDTPNMAEDKMIALWREIFSLSAGPLGADSDFFALGGDSLKAARLFAAIRRDFQIDLPLATLLEAPTPRQLVRRIGGSSWVAPWLSLVPIQTAGSRLPLFCVHGGAGNIISFRFVADCLPDRPVYGLQAQGLKPGDRPLETVEEMADHYLQSVRALCAHGPYLFAGHSLGAAIACEMAQRMVAAGEQVPFLGLLDHPGPQIHQSPLDWLRFHWSVVTILPPAERWMYIRRGIAWRLLLLLVKWRMRIAPVQPAKPAGRSTLDMLEHSLRALRNYHIRPYPGRLTLFRAARGSPRIHSDPTGGWEGVAAGGIDVYEVKGSHMTMLNQPFVSELGAAIAQCLDKVDARAEAAP